MNFVNKDIQIISAPSILGLKPTGVENLSESLLAAGLVENLQTSLPVVHVQVLNALYNDKRDLEDNCLNSKAIRDFSITLNKVISSTVNQKRFPFVLGGDCSILIGIMMALKARGNFGLIFLDAHADFYESDKSVTGEVADMDLAIVTGRGPLTLTNIDNLQPYVRDENVIHIGQRDWEETKKYGSQDIRETSITCFDIASIQEKGGEQTTFDILKFINTSEVDGFWIHFDTDVLSDKINPAVDYRLEGGLLFEQIEYLIEKLLLTRRMAGTSVTIFNPKLDKDGTISKSITESIGRAFGGK